jgi:putative SOS response-associated peptidase YedK
MNASTSCFRRDSRNLPHIRRFLQIERMEYFDCASDEPDWAPRYNLAPTQPVLVIRQNPKEPVRELSLMRWGLIPS